MSPKIPASDVLHLYLRTQVSAVESLDPQVRRGEPDAVHQMRVACRRLRSALATFRPLVDRDATDPMRDELAWLAGVLGEVRDLEVVTERLRDLVAAEPQELSADESSSHFEDVLGVAEAAAKGRVAEAMDSDRYRRLLHRLPTLVDDVAWTGRASKPAGKVLRKRVRRDWLRLRDRVTAADGSDPDDRAERLHDVRKAAKRLRYANDAVMPVFGGRARRLAKAAKRIQTVLGDHHDAAVSRDLLRELASRPDLDPSHALLYGRLHALEQVQQVELEMRYLLAWEKASKKRRSGWLTD